MLMIDKLVVEFEETYNEFLQANENNEFHEASDIESYMTGITRSMTIVLDASVVYTPEDRTAVDKCISKLNYIHN